MGAYFGSKATSGLCQAIIALMPPHDTYIETHLGGGAIMKRKPPALRSIGIDLNARALARFRCDYPVQMIHGCAHRFLREYDYQGRELVYCDPPYLHHTRSSERRYRFDYQEQDHLELLALLKGLPCKVILCGYPSALYDEQLGDWGQLEIQVMNQAGVRQEQGIALGWEDVRDLPAGCTVTKTFPDDTLPGGPVQRTIEYQAPFVRPDREQDYRVAWAFFQQQHDEDAAA